MYWRLTHFLAVQREGTFTAGARAAGLSQPALSASIQKLEADLGTALFHRGRSGASLTDAGVALLPHARAAIAAVDEGRRAVDAVLGLARGEVRIGGGATATTYLLPDILAAFQTAHPEISTVLREMSTPEVIDAVHEGQIDLGIATRLPDDSRPWPVDEEAWRDDPLILVASPREERATPPFLTFLRGSPLRSLLDRHFPEAHVCMELGSIAAIKGNVAAGVGVALVPLSAVQASLEDGRLVRWSDPRVPLHRRLVVVHRGLERLSVASRAFLAQLR